MSNRNVAAILLGTTLSFSIPATIATAQTGVAPNGTTLTARVPAPTVDGGVNSPTQRELGIESRLSKDLQSGGLSRARFDLALLELNNIRVQETELASRDGGLNATDRDFIEARLTQLEKNLIVSPVMPVTPLVFPPNAPALQNFAETPGALTCNGKRVLLSIGRDHATASVQRYGDANIALIVEAVGSPYDSGDGITLRVTGPGLSAKVDGARSGAFLTASTTTNFSLKSKHLAKIEADVRSDGRAAAAYVKIWGSCSRG